MEFFLVPSDYRVKVTEVSLGKVHAEMNPSSVHFHRKSQHVAMDTRPLSCHENYSSHDVEKGREGDGRFGLSEREREGQRETE